MARTKLDKLKDAGANLEKYFTDVSENTVTNKSTESKPVKNKPIKKVFSFRADTESILEWRLYADARGLKIEDFGVKALTEYMKKHPLTDAQKQVYDAKKALKSI